MPMNHIPTDVCLTTANITSPGETGLAIVTDAAGSISYHAKYDVE